MAFHFWLNVKTDMNRSSPTGVKGLCKERRLSLSQTYSDKIWAVVMKDRLHFYLFSFDSRVGQSQINEEVLANNHLQRLSNADT